MLFRINLSHYNYIDVTVLFVSYKKLMNVFHIIFINMFYTQHSDRIASMVLAKKKENTITLYTPELLRWLLTPLTMELINLSQHQALKCF